MSAADPLTCPDGVPWCAEHTESQSGEPIFYAHRSSPVSVGSKHQVTLNLEQVGLRGRRGSTSPVAITVAGGTLTPAETRRLAAELLELANLAERPLP